MPCGRKVITVGSYVRRDGRKLVPVIQHNRVIGYAKPEFLKEMMKPVQKTEMSPALRENIRKLRMKKLP